MGALWARAERRGADPEGGLARCERARRGRRGLLAERRRALRDAARPAPRGGSRGGLPQRQRGVLGGNRREAGGAQVIVI